MSLTAAYKGRGSRKRWETPEELIEAISDYFETCDELNDVPTKAGLVLHIDSNTSTLHDYEKREGYSEAIKRAYKVIENYWNRNLKEGNASGSIFYLKAAFHYKDRQDIDVTSGGKPVPIYGGISGHTGDEEDIQPEEEN